MHAAVDGQGGASDVAGAIRGEKRHGIGHFLGLMQFVTTFLITWLYLRQAKTRLDPLATQIREQLEGDAR